MIFTRDEKTKIFMSYPAGQRCNEHGNMSAKYEKFVYSNVFSFSVSRGNDLEMGAFDNTLVVSEANENFYRSKLGTEVFFIDEKYTYMKYKIMNDVEIESYIIPIGLWHVRVHKIKTNKNIDIADGGFALPIEKNFTIAVGKGNGKFSEKDIIIKDNVFILNSDNKTIAISDETGGSDFAFVRAYPNTNLISPLTGIPTLKKSLVKGEHVFVSSHYGNLSSDIDFMDKKPKVTLGDVITIECGTKLIVI